MSPTFDLYIDRRSWLHNLDPRTKLLIVSFSMILLLIFNNLFITLAFLIGAHLILLSADIPWSKTKWVWERMWPITLLIIVLWPLFYQEGDHALFQFWKIKVTSLSLVEGTAMALRVDALAFVCFILLFSTNQAELVRGLVKSGLPFEWGLTMAIALRYVPTLYGIYVTISEAQQARGWVIGRGDFAKRIRSYVPVLVAMIITALRMTDNLAMTLAARGLGTGTKRTYFKEVNFGRSDVVCLATFLTLFAILALARFKYDFGARPW